MLVQVAPLAMTAAPAVESDESSDSAWLEALFREHYAAVLRWTRALGVAAAATDDVTQQVFLIAARRRTQLVGGTSVRAWLFAITRRACANHRRGDAREQARRAKADPPIESPSPEGAAERARAATLLQAFLDGLPDAQRLVFVLYEIEGLDAPEVGQMLEISADKVHARVRMARQKLEQFVERERRLDRGGRR